MVGVDGTGLRRLTTDPATDQYPQWSPDGTTIVYDNAGARENSEDPQFSKTAEIFTVPAATGGAPTRLTHNSWRRHRAVVFPGREDDRGSVGTGTSR